MYSLTRVWIGLKLARMLIHVSVVVSTTSATDMPSTPSLYWMPKTRDPVGTVSTNWKPVDASASKPTRSSSETTQVASAVPAPAGRAQALRQERDEDRADERQERDERQDRQGVHVHRRSPTRRRYEPAMTISPTAMPSA